jgi:NAD(P)H dehydrogenase (quinone)
MQNILGVWGSIVRDDVFRFPYPAQTRLSLVDLDDVGEAAAVVLTRDGHGGATYELAGTAALTQSEVAAALAAALGRSVRAEAEPLAAWERAPVTLAAMFRYYAAHGLVGNTNTLRWLLGRAPTSLTSFLARAPET